MAQLTDEGGLIQYSDGYNPRLESRSTDVLHHLVLWRVQGYLAHKKRPPPHDRTRALGIGLLQIPRRRQSLMGEVALYPR